MTSVACTNATPALQAGQGTQNLTSRPPSARAPAMGKHALPVDGGVAWQVWRPRREWSAAHKGHASALDQHLDGRANENVGQLLPAQLALPLLQAHRQRALLVGIQALVAAHVGGSGLTRHQGTGLSQAPARGSLHTQTQAQAQRPPHLHPPACSQNVHALQAVPPDCPSRAAGGTPRAPQPSSWQAAQQASGDATRSRSPTTTPAIMALGATAQPRAPVPLGAGVPLLAASAAGGGGTILASCAYRNVA